MTALSEFLSARIADEEDLWRSKFVASCGPGAPEAEVVAAWDKLAVTVWLRFSIVIRQMGVELRAIYWPRSLKRLAAPYADHPDYDPSWRP